MPEPQATEATIHLLYKAYYMEMGGVGAPPDVLPRQAEPVADNVTAFRRPPARLAKPQKAYVAGNRPLPVALIFACLVVVYVGIRYFWR